MWIQDLAIHNFRNFERANLRCGSFWNVLFGKNAQGKTNILEAIYFLLTLRSFRTKNTCDLLRKGSDSFAIRAVILHSNVPYNLRAGYEGGKKRLFLNEESLFNLEKVIGVFPVVVVTGENIDFVKQPPLMLRRFLDSQLSQSIPEYLRVLLQYEKVLRFRNLILKQEKPSSKTQLKVWTEKLVQLGARILDWRRNAVKRLGIFARLNLKKISGRKGELEVRYLSEVSGAGEKEIINDYERKLAESALLEKKRGFTLIGPHRDSIGFYINGTAANKVASAGERKSIGFAMKMAEADNIKSFCNTEPVMLIDEVVNEIDIYRRKNLYSLMPKKRQVFFATFEYEVLKEITKSVCETKVFRINEGKCSLL